MAAERQYNAFRRQLAKMTARALRATAAAQGDMASLQGTLKHVDSLMKNGCW